MLNENTDWNDQNLAEIQKLQNELQTHKDEILYVENKLRES